MGHDVQRSPHHESRSCFYSAAAALMWVLTLGPSPSLLGRAAGHCGPYRLLMSLPGFDEMRVPARLWMLSVLCLAAAGGARGCAHRQSLARGVLSSSSASSAWCSMAGRVRSRSPAAPDLRPPAGNGTRRAAGAATRRQRNRIDVPHDRGRPAGLQRVQRLRGAATSGAARPARSARSARFSQRLASCGPIQIVVEHAWTPMDRGAGMSKSAGARRLDGGHGLDAVRVARPPMPPSFVASGMPVPIARVDANVNPSDINAVIDNNLEHALARARTARDGDGDDRSRNEPAGLGAGAFSRLVHVSISPRARRWNRPRTAYELAPRVVGTHSIARVRCGRS